jgi:hypothetical protein
MSEGRFRLPGWLFVLLAGVLPLIVLDEILNAVRGYGIAFAATAVVAAACEIALIVERRRARL